MTVDAARPRSWGVARLSFGHPENLATLPKSGGNPLPVVADCKGTENKKTI